MPERSVRLAAPVSMLPAEAEEVQILLAESRAGGGRAARFLVRHSPQGDGGRPGAPGSPPGAPGSPPGAPGSPPGAPVSPPSLLGAGCSDAAVRGFDELERLRLWNAVWWATEGVQLYRPLLRWYLAALQEVPPGPVKQELYARAATCYYRLGLYEKWEAGQVLCGKTPARSIEKALRWDQKSSFNGRGYEVLSEYVQQGRKQNAG